MNFQNLATQDLDPMDQRCQISTQSQRILKVPGEGIQLMDMFNQEVHETILLTNHTDKANPSNLNLMLELELNLKLPYLRWLMTHLLCQININKVIPMIDMLPRMVNTVANNLVINMDTRNLKKDSSHLQEVHLQHQELAVSQMDQRVDLMVFQTVPSLPNLLMPYLLILHLFVLV